MNSEDQQIFPIGGTCTIEIRGVRLRSYGHGITEAKVTAVFLDLNGKPHPAVAPIPMKDVRGQRGTYAGEFLVPADLQHDKLYEARITITVGIGPGASNRTIHVRRHARKTFA